MLLDYIHYFIKESIHFRNIQKLLVSEGEREWL
jgi:hypothetical protein